MSLVHIVGNVWVNLSVWNLDQIVTLVLGVVVRNYEEFLKFIEEQVLKIYIQSREVILPSFENLNNYRSSVPRYIQELESVCSLYYGLLEAHLNASN